MPHPSRSTQAVPSTPGAQPEPTCTCTALCGDDPGIRDAKVTPCAWFVECQRARFARDAAPDLLLAVEGLIEAAEAGAPSLEAIRIGRAAIAKASGCSA